MRLKTLLKVSALFFFLFLFARPTSAIHLYGSEFTYEFLGSSGNPTNPFRYKFNYKVYRSTAANAQQVNFDVFRKDGSAIFSTTLNPTNGNGTPIPLPVPPNCTVTGLPNILLWTYETTINLPLTFDGYYATAEIGNRNSDITNLQNSGAQTIFTYLEVPSALFPSKSPVFTDTAVVVMFTNDTTTIINSAFDVDGDKLIYSFNQPFGGAGFGPFIPNATTIPQRINYNPGFSLTQPFGAGGFASINASTGLAKYYVPNPGNYVVSFQVKEYRNVNGVDVLIGSTIRDIQLVVKNVPVSTNVKPNFTFTGPTVITIPEGAAIPPINFTFTDPDASQNKILKVTSAQLLDGPGGKNASFTFGATTFTTGPTISNVANGSTGTFNFTSVCGQSGSYTFDLTFTDNACPPGSKKESFRIEVVPYEGPEKITGDTTVCTNSTPEVYSVPNKASATYNWRLQGGGTIISGKNTNAATINWTSIGRFKLTAIETGTGNCNDSVSFFVNVTPGVALTLSPSTAICQGGNASLTVSGGGNYIWTNNQNGTTLTGPNVVVSPTVTTTYSVTSNGMSGCNANSSVTVTVNPLPPVDAGADRSVCAGGAVNLTGSTGTGTGINYVWTNNLNGTTLTGHNITVNPTATITYTVTGTNPTTNCTKSDQVTITVTPGPVPAFVGLNTAYCKNAAAVTLASTLTGSTFTIDGTAATVLNPATLAVGTHTVVVSKTESGCTGSSTQTVTINAMPAPAFVGLNTAYCKNATAVTLASTLTGSTFTIDGTAATSLNPATLTLGTHTVVVTKTENGCTGTATQTVTINAVPAPAFVGLNTAYCKDAAAVTLASTLTGSTFTIDGTAATTLNPATLAAGTHTVVVSKIENGCLGTATQTVTINAVPAPAFVGLNTAYCKDAAAITLASTLTGSTFTIDGTAATTLNPATLAVGTHTVVVSNTANGCTGTTSQTVTINAVPTANFGTLGTVYCQNSPAVSLIVTGSTFTIDGTAATTLNPATLSVGTHNVVVTTTNAATSCSVTATRVVTINAVPAPAFVDLNTAYCKDAAAITLASTLTGSTFTIDGTAVTTLDPAALALGTHTVVVSNTANGCTGTMTQTVTINAVPAANFSTLGTVYCQNAPAVSLVVAGSTFTIDGTPATTFDPATLTVGNHNVVVTTTNATTNCSVTATKVVTINAVPTPSLAFLNPGYCKDAAAVTLPGGTGISYTIDGTASTTLNPATLSVGNHTVVMQQTNAAGCSASVSRSITINAVPVGSPGTELEFAL